MCVGVRRAWQGVVSHGCALDGGTGPPQLSEAPQDDPRTCLKCQSLEHTHNVHSHIVLPILPTTELVNSLWHIVNFFFPATVFILLFVVELFSYLWKIEIINARVIFFFYL